jgi:hypothetical protein
MKTTHFKPNIAATVAVATPCWSRAGLGDDPALAHAPREQHLADAIVDLGAPVQEVFTLEINFGAAEFARQPLGEVADVGRRRILSGNIQIRAGTPGPSARGGGIRPPTPCNGCIRVSGTNVRHTDQSGRGHRLTCLRAAAHARKR